MALASNTHGNWLCLESRLIWAWDLNRRAPGVVPATAATSHPVCHFGDLAPKMLDTATSLMARATTSRERIVASGARDAISAMWRRMLARKW